LAHVEWKAASMYKGWDAAALLGVWNGGIKDVPVVAPSLDEERTGKRARQEQGGTKEQAEAFARFNALSHTRTR
jgi:hypothetical protein